MSTPTIAGQDRDPAKRVEAILRDLMDAAQSAEDEIFTIAEAARDTFLEESPEYRAWQGFGAFGTFSDLGHAFAEIKQHIAALRGFLIYRRLDPQVRHAHDTGAPLTQPPAPTELGQSG